ncbi:site-specific DNA-methyltransferase [uncultured Peptoniphilus sp.]|uniref:site-specific DNA-methyltransferase n=1 Tax=uncultured Peptoniphilus sp. TaxID=254354 RepID=UPI002805080F|nr:site-specific DNA-methyltransferase [uncultured Peptoniphilus sp.]
MKENIFEKVAKLLKSQEKYISEDGELLKAKVYSDIMTMDKDLIRLLLSDEEIKDTFFVRVEDTLVFDKQKSAWLIDSKEFLPDSYTAYTNKIGLTSGGDFISSKNDIVLDFPYKDCILEGGQDKDDQKREEIFYNEILASDEIRRMLDPKVFTNAKRYKKDGFEENITFNEDDNLIIKGNNLIALTSILKRYEGKVKCIYIDPPYNTGSDSFNYNDSFNHSSWLTFMKNRLEIAKKLLKDDGVIFVQCDDNEQAYLKVLMDDIFGRENFVATVPRITKKAGKSTEVISKNHDYILIFKINNISFKQLEIDEDDYPYKDEYYKDRGSYKLNQALDYDSLGYVKSLDYPIEINGVVFYPGSDKQKWIDRQSGIVSTKDWAWRWRWELFEFGRKNNFIVVKNKRIYTKTYTKAKIRKNKDGSYYIEYFNRGKTPSSLQLLENKYSNDNSKKELEKTFGKKVFNYSKPETLLEFILNLTTQPNDIVLDFHLGSGTTAAVAHKMGRSYIGIEQMDYIKDITVERLKKVLDGEQGGISKSVNWQGGGSFVYCELKENANELIKLIQNANEITIEDIKTKIYKDDRIIPYVMTQELEEVDSDFENLSLEDKKKALIKLIDKNKLYVNYSDIDNEDYKISEDEKKFTRSFYEVHD